MTFEQSPRPRHVEIADDLRRRIEAGEWGPGDYFMSHRAVMDEYEVSGNTAAAARRILLEQGLLKPRPGARMTVRQPPERRRIDRTGPTPASVALPLRDQEVNAGRIGEWASQTRSTTAPATIAQLLAVDTGARVFRTDYQYRADGQLVRVASTWEPDTVVGGTVVMLPEEGPYAGRSVVERMDAIGITPLTVVDELVACPADHAEARLLAVGLGSPVLKAIRTYAAPDGRPVHVEQSIVRGDTSSMVYRLPAG